MSQLSKSKPIKAVGALGEACKLAWMVLSIVSAVIIVVPVGAGAIVAWAAGMVFDALRPKRAGDDLV